MSNTLARSSRPVVGKARAIGKVHRGRGTLMYSLSWRFRWQAVAAAMASFPWCCGATKKKSRKGTTLVHVMQVALISIRVIGAFFQEAGTVIVLPVRNHNLSSLTRDARLLPPSLANNGISDWPDFAARRKGRIMMVSSVVSAAPNPTVAAYAASKSYLTR